MSGASHGAAVDRVGASEISAFALFDRYGPCCFGAATELIVRQPMVPPKHCASFYEMKIYRGLGIKIR